jgi:hypothetical protein
MWHFGVGVSVKVILYILHKTEKFVENKLQFLKIDVMNRRNFLNNLFVVSTIGIIGINFLSSLRRDDITVKNKDVHFPNPLIHQYPETYDECYMSFEFESMGFIFPDKKV